MRLTIDFADLNILYVSIVYHAIQLHIVSKTTDLRQRYMYAKPHINSNNTTAALKQG